MKATDYNNYPEWMKRSLDKTVIYVYNDIKKDPDNAGKFIIPNIVKFKLLDMIVVADEDGLNKKPISIAYSTGANPDGSLIIGGDLFFSREGFGRIVCNPLKASDHAKFMFMEYSNMNGSNPNRDPSAPIIWRREDFVSDAKVSREDRAVRKEAIVESLGLPVHVVDTMINILGTRDMVHKSEEEKRDFLEAFAERDPKKFLITLNSNISKVIDMIKQAKNHGIIRNDTKKCQFFLMPSDELLFDYSKVDRKKLYDLFAKYILGDQDLYKVIESKLFAEKEAV